MKYIMPLLSILYSISCYSQTPNPDLFRTWYLYDYYSTDDNIHHPVSAVTPTISPRVTFTDAFSFSGVGACNGFGGNYSSPASDLLLFNNFAGTLVLCSSSAQIQFEGAYFSLFQTSGQYFISGQGDAMSLVIMTPIFNNYVFGTTQLATPDFYLKQMVVSPNPVVSQLFVDSQNHVIDKIELFNSLGQTVKTVSSTFDVIDVSDLASGVYLMKVYAEGTVVSKKIIKQ